MVAGAFVVAACGSDTEQLSEDIYATAATEEEVEQFFQDEGGKVRDGYVSNVQGQVFLTFAI